jgi:peptidoglycan L-alanyl-D-glutamate endopeptidase CwlK
MANNNLVPVMALGGFACAAALALATTRKTGGTSMQTTTTPPERYPEEDWTEEQRMAAASPKLRLPELLRALEARGWQPRVIFTWRSRGLQARLRAMGRSGVSFSFHNAVDAQGRPAALAADIVDRRYGWAAAPGQSKDRAAAFFKDLGVLAKGLGLHWGGDWHGRASAWADWGIGWDPAHVQALPNDQLARIRRESEAAGFGCDNPAKAWPIARRGDQGEHVRVAQRRLGITPDGIFGERTEAAVRRYQTASGLDVDGVIGPKTWSRLAPV